MKKICIFIIFLFVTACTTEHLKSKSLEGMPPRTPFTLVKIKGEDCTWKPDVIKVEKDTYVIMQVESVDWDYNFMLSDYNLKFNVPKGKQVTAEFYANKAGEFEFGCYIEKGKRYLWGGMVGKLIVE
jgi:heme/copper-type cytochrome/quinol oxidase subunit 2